MTQDGGQPAGLTPADGVPTTARRLIDDTGTSVTTDEAYKYIRVVGSSISNLEPHFWGDGAAIARFPDKRNKADHYYVTEVLKRIEISVQKLAKAEKDRIRIQQFETTKGLSRYLRSGEITPWDQIPDEYGRARYLMWLAQTRADELRAIGFDEGQIGECARRGFLGVLSSNRREVKFHVHHRIPLQIGGANSIDNLCLVEGSVHNPFFHKGDDPVLNKMRKGDNFKVALTIPTEDVHIIALGFNVRELIIARR